MAESCYHSQPSTEESSSKSDKIRPSYKICESLICSAVLDRLTKEYSI